MSVSFSVYHCVKIIVLLQALRWIPQPEISMPLSKRFGVCSILKKKLSTTEKIYFQTFIGLKQNRRQEAQNMGKSALAYVNSTKYRVDFRDNVLFFVAVELCWEKIDFVTSDSQ